MPEHGDRRPRERPHSLVPVVARFLPGAHVCLVVAGELLATRQGLERHRHGSKPSHSGEGARKGPTQARARLAQANMMREGSNVRLGWRAEWQLSSDQPDKLSFVHVGDEDLDAGKMGVTRPLLFWHVQIHRAFD